MSVFHLHDDVSVPKDALQRRDIPRSSYIDWRRCAEGCASAAEELNNRTSYELPEMPSNRDLIDALGQVTRVPGSVPGTLDHSVLPC